MNETTVFDRILAGQIPAEVVYEDDCCVAFRDIAPKAPVHVLVIPRRRITGLQTAAEADVEALGRLLLAARRVAEREGILDAGFRCVVNAGADGGQEVAYLHVHVLGGRHLSWPPG